MKPHPSFVQPYLDKQDIKIDIVDGHLIFAPAKAASVGHLVHFHGIGGLSSHELNWAHRLAAGQFLGQAVTVVMPMSTALAEQNLRPLRNILSLNDLRSYLKQHPAEVRTMLYSALATKKIDVSEVIETFRNMPLWYVCAFETDAGPLTLIKTLQLILLKILNPKESAHLQPDVGANLRAMHAVTEKVSPTVIRVLEKIGAEPGHCCVSGYSQGVALAILLGGHFQTDFYQKIIAMCGFHIHAPHYELIKDRQIKFIGLYPTHDPVFDMFAPLAATKEEITADFAGGSRVCKMPGGHRVDGHIAHAAGIEIASTLAASHRNRHVKSAPHQPAPVVVGVTLSAARLA